MIGIAAMALLGVAALCFATRLVLGPTIPDRLLALDGLLLCVVGGLGVEIARGGTTVVASVMVLIAVVAFVGAAMAARFIERRGA